MLPIITPLPMTTQWRQQTWSTAEWKQSLFCFRAEPKIILKLVVKSPRFVPFGANRIKFGAHSLVIDLLEKRFAQSCQIFSYACLYFRLSPRLITTPTALILINNITLYLLCKYLKSFVKFIEFFFMCNYCPCLIFFFLKMSCSCKFEE